MQIEAAFSLSEEYYKFMSDFAQTSFEDDKLLGKFYTDFTVAKRMGGNDSRKCKTRCFFKRHKID